MEAPRALFVAMITVGVIKNGARYLSRHLRKNDYWTEGEKAVQGVWIGEGAARLGLKGPVENREFDAVRRNRHPLTGEKLTPRENKERVAFFDVQLSAPKDVSVLAMVGGDERVVTAFREAVAVALEEMERFAAVREREGDSRNTEDFRLTGNFIGALFFHDTSRELDPQLHAHAVFANATWDEQRGGWFALQPAEMLRASGYLRQVLYRELSGRLRQLGYETYGMNSNGFAIRGVEHLRERFSKRTHQIEALVETFTKDKGRRPTKREIEVLVRESRANKLADVSTAEVRRRQRSELSDTESDELEQLVQAAREQPPRETISHGMVASVLEAALRHVFERASVVREGEVLHAALELHPEFYRWRELRDALAAHTDAIRAHGELSLRPIHREEIATVRRVIEGRNTRMALGDAAHLPEKLTLGQRNAARALLGSTDFLLVLVGDAGTGKTTVLSAIEQAHRSAGGREFFPLAPTTRAREALAHAGFDSADTVQRFLVSDPLQLQAAGRVILVDEAGLLSTQQLDTLTRIAEARRARVLLVGDTKQHYSVQRGDAMRNVVRHSGTPVVRISEVLRQREEKDRYFSRLLAKGEVTEALLYASRRHMIRELGNDRDLFAAAAEKYADNLARGVDTLVVIPFWEEIDRFSIEARAALRRRGLLGADEVTRDGVRPLTWTEEQKAHWNQYRPGDRLLFVRDTRFFHRGTAAEVKEVLSDGVVVMGDGGRFAKITRKQRGSYDVGRAQRLALSAGDRVLIRGREDDQGFANGDFKQVAAVDPATGAVWFSDGTILPADFRAWTYGHALTSYRAQGSTSEESLLVLGEVAERALMRRQFYVGNTRYRGAHHIYVAHRDAILARVARPDPGRELATEFTRRHRIVVAEEIATRRVHRMGTHLRQVWASMAARWREMRQAPGERTEV